jgi:hypothetical protein
MNRIEDVYEQTQVDIETNASTCNRDVDNLAALNCVSLDGVSPQSNAIRVE